MITKDTALNIMSFNIRYDSDNGTESWDMRKKNLIPLVLSIEPDCIGFQEVLPNQYEDLINGLSEYSFIGKPRDDGISNGERSAIFFKKNRFELFDSGDFWLADTPDVPSLGWDAECIRICTYVGLYDKITGKEFYHFNTHLDHIGRIAMIQGAKLICSSVKDKDFPTFVTGDFNVYENSETYNTMIENGLLDTKYNALAKHSYGTFHGYQPTDNLINESPIDYIFYTDSDFDIDEYKVIINGSDGEYTSDHYPILAKIIQK